MFSFNVFHENVSSWSAVATDVTGVGLVVFLPVMSQTDLGHSHEVTGVAGVKHSIVDLMDGLDVVS